MRVVFLVGAFFPKPMGAAFAALNLARALRSQGTDVGFVVDVASGAWEDGGTYEGFPVRAFPLSTGTWRDKLRGWWSCARYLRKIQSLDLLHIHGGGYINLILGQWLRFATGRKVILKISSDGWDTPEAIVAGRHGWLAGWCYRRLDGLIAMTSGQANKCRTWGYRGHLEVIPNGVDCSRFRPASEGKKLSLRRQFGLDTKAIVMCYIGVLRRRKGIDILFRVWQELSRRGNVILLIAGGYPGTDAEQVFLSALKEQGFDVPPEGIVYLGHMSNTEQCLQASDIFVFPSRKEGFGTVQIEAMACGLPCFVNDLPGVSSDIFPSKEFGHRIENNDVERYVELITHCLRNPDMYEKIACKARERAEHVYSIERIASTYRQFYACVMGESCREKPSCPSAN